MKITDASIAWTPTWAKDPWDAMAGKIIVVGRPPGSVIDPYQYWVYADGGRPETPEAGLTRLFTQFNTCVVRDGIDPQLAHKAFLEIDEYRYGISRDMEGAKDPPDESGSY